MFSHKKQYFVRWHDSAAVFGSSPKQAEQWLAILRAQPDELWRIAERAQGQAARPRSEGSADVEAVKVSIRNACRGSLSRTHNMALRIAAAVAAAGNDGVDDGQPLKLNGAKLREELERMRPVLETLGDWPPPNARAIRHSAAWLDAFESRLGKTKSGK